MNIIKKYLFKMCNRMQEEELKFQKVLRLYRGTLILFFFYNCWTLLPPNGRMYVTTGTGLSALRNLSIKLWLMNENTIFYQTYECCYNI